MHRRVALNWAACTLLAAAACGCGTAPQVVRGQSPAPIADPAVTPASHAAHHQAPAVSPSSYNHYGWPHQAAANHLYQQQVSFHSTSGYPGYSGAPCPTGNCPPAGYPGAYGAGAQCPQGCPPHGCHHKPCPTHYHSYSYSRPRDLVYPPPSVPGGAVVYPYYTHKGPSDFFRAE
ncbi:MAG: hypothetical protein ACF8PG_16455 [Maioricimonas sp. JB045]|uniref:hypothetical protein n=1 Tax=Maioricimonas sp. JC845 TaxID=3232138 RepID=UPI0034574077